MDKDQKSENGDQKSEKKESIVLEVQNVKGTIKIDNIGGKKEQKSEDGDQKSEKKESIVLNVQNVKSTIKIDKVGGGENGQDSAQ